MAKYETEIQLLKKQKIRLIEKKNELKETLQQDLSNIKLKQDSRLVDDREDEIETKQNKNKLQVPTKTKRSKKSDSSVSGNLKTNSKSNKRQVSEEESRRVSSTKKKRRPSHKSSEGRVEEDNDLANCLFDAAMFV